MFDNLAPSNHPRDIHAQGPAPTSGVTDLGGGWTALVGPAGGVGWRPDGEVADRVESLGVLVGDQTRLGLLDASGLRARVAALRRLAGLADAGLARAVTALEHTGAMARDGAPSPAEWVKAHTGRSGRDAARTVRLAERLDELPATAAALADGAVSAESADVIVRAARGDRLGAPDEVEAELLQVATGAGPERLRRHVRVREQRARGDALLRDERRQHALREATLVRDGDSGMWDLRARVPDESGTRLRTALDAFDIPTDATKGRPRLRLADALDAMATAILDHGHAPQTAGVARPHLSVLVDVDTLIADLTAPAVDGDGLSCNCGAGADGADTAETVETRDRACRSDCPAAPGERAVASHDPVWADLPPGVTTWGSVLSPQAVRRLGCDAAVSRIVMAGQSMPLDVGRTTRDWSGPQRRAVHARDRGCRGPACDRPIAWTQVHHLQWWRNDGPTAVDNGLALCHHCHRLVHDHGWTVCLDTATAAATWTSPRGAVTVTHPPDLPARPGRTLAEPTLNLEPPAPPAPSEPPGRRR